MYLVLHHAKTLISWACEEREVSLIHPYSRKKVCRKTQQNTTKNKALVVAELVLAPQYASVTAPQW